MKDLLKSYFLFNKRDRNGMLSLMFLLVGLIVLPSFYPYLFPREPQDFSEFHQEIAEVLPLFQLDTSLQTSVATAYNSNYHANYERNSDDFGHHWKAGKPTQMDKHEPSQKSKVYAIKQNEIKPFVFNPNKLNFETAQQLGFSPKQAQVVVNYLERGGQFYKPADFKKLYVVDDEQYERLKDYIQIPAKERKIKKTRNHPKSAKTESTESVFAQTDSKKEPTKPIEWNLAKFDPNQLTFEQAISMGFPEKLAQTFDNYLSKGGYFKTKEDLKKIYGLEEVVYKTIEPFIEIAEPTKTNSISSNKAVEKAEPPKKAIKIELNTANVDSLLLVPGIGPFFAKNIIKYRNELGGFHQKEQLMEVYKIDEEKYQTIAPFLTLESKMQKIHLNEIEYQALLEHPYIDHKIAKVITKLRDQHGPFQHISDLQKSYLIDESLFKRLEPYLTVE